MKALCHCGDFDETQGCGDSGVGAGQRGRSRWVRWELACAD